MRIFGRKPSELRKTAVVVLSTSLVLVVALPPLAGISTAAAAGVAGFIVFCKAAHLYLTRPDVAEIIDSADNL